MFGFVKREFFEIESPADREVPQVSFGAGGDAGAAPPPAPQAPPPAPPAPEAGSQG
jgi:hypothetical protein